MYFLGVYQSWIAAVIKEHLLPASLLVIAHLIDKQLWNTQNHVEIV